METYEIKINGSEGIIRLRWNKNEALETFAEFVAKARKGAKLTMFRLNCGKRRLICRRTK